MKLQMIKETHIDVKPVSKTQGKIFEYAAEKSKMFEFKDFVDNYMNSDFCLRVMDASYAYDQISPIRDLAPDIDDLLPPLFVGFTPVSKDTAYWMGFMYRFISRKYDIPSKTLYEYVPYKDMLFIIENTGIDNDIHDMERMIVEKINEKNE